VVTRPITGGGFGIGRALSQRSAHKFGNYVIIVGRRKRLFDDYPTLAISTTMLVGSLVGHVGFGCGVFPGKDFGSFES
jgi:NAD(P)-dependent dehydrogenase (short-subunit alcohol dehydrogenase family)